MMPRQREYEYEYEAGTAKWIKSKLSEFRGYFVFSMLSAKMLKFHGISDYDFLFGVLFRQRHGPALRRHKETPINFEEVVARNEYLLSTSPEFVEAVERFVYSYQKEQKLQKKSQKLREDNWKRINAIAAKEFEKLA